MIGWLTDSFSSQPESPFDSALMPLFGMVELAWQRHSVLESLLGEPLARDSTDAEESASQQNQASRLWSVLSYTAIISAAAGAAVVSIGIAAGTSMNGSDCEECGARA